MILKNKQELDTLQEGGAILAQALDRVCGMVKQGARIKELDALAEKLIIEAGGAPSFKNYSHSKKMPKFPTTLCISVNDELVHGTANRDIILKNGDIIGLDVGMCYKKFYTDMARTVAVGEITKKTQKLLNVTEGALFIGIAHARPGRTIGAIGQAIQVFVEKEDFSVIRDLSGHGVGRAVHEEPHIPNFYPSEYSNFLIKEGMVLALEPMVSMGGFKLKVDPIDGWTTRTADGSLTAHFEHTIAVLKDKTVIITK